MTVTLLELLLVFELLCDTVMSLLLEDDADPVETLLPPPVELLDVAVLLDVAEPPLPPVAVLSPAPPEAAPAPSAELVALCPVPFAWLVETTWVFDPEFAVADWLTPMLTAEL